jgi:hypothetical protein
MKTPASVKQVKRRRSVSMNRSKEDSNKEENARSSEEEEKGVCDSTESEKDGVADKVTFKVVGATHCHVTKMTSCRYDILLLQIL